MPQKGEGKWGRNWDKPTAIVFYSNRGANQNAGGG